MLRYSSLTIFVLVLLRFAIGWHFLTEGWQKVESQQAKDDPRNVAFTSRGYFQNSPGPFADWARPYLMEDENDEIISYFVVAEMPEGEDPTNAKLAERLPEKLSKEWDDYFERFAAHYDLGPDHRKAAQAKLLQAKADAVRWMTFNPSFTELKAGEANPEFFDLRVRVSRAAGKQANPVPKSIPERLEELQAARKRLESIRSKRYAVNERKYAGAEYAYTAAEVSKFRNELASYREELTESMAKHLETALPKGYIDKKKMEKQLQGEPSEVQPGESKKDLIGWMDLIVPWFLTVVGGLLMLGFLTRFSAFLGAMFLLSAYLFAMPLPWVPLPPTTEGSPIFVNKTLIEMLALLALATMHTGTFFGVDALFTRKKYNEEVARENGETEQDELEDRL